MILSCNRLGMFLSSIDWVMQMREDVNISIDSIGCSLGHWSDNAVWNRLIDDSIDCYQWEEVYQHDNNDDLNAQSVIRLFAMVMVSCRRTVSIVHRHIDMRILDPWWER
jgi:hypothetical protein